MYCITALKIHCSFDCKQLLDQLGGYHVEERGYISMKVQICILQPLYDIREK